MHAARRVGSRVLASVATDGAQQGPVADVGQFRLFLVSDPEKPGGLQHEASGRCCPVFPIASGVRYVLEIVRTPPGETAGLIVCDRLGQIRLRSTQCLREAAEESPKISPATLKRAGKNTDNPAKR